MTFASKKARFVIPLADGWEVQGQGPGSWWGSVTC